MAFYKTHSISYPTGIDVELYQDLGSAPASVEKLPLLKEGTSNLQFKCSTDLGYGVITYSFTCRFLDSDNLSSIFTQTDTAKVKLIISDSSYTYFTGFPELDTFSKVIKPGINPFDITFVDGFSRSKHISIKRYDSWVNVNVSEMIDNLGEIANYDADGVTVHPWVVLDPADSEVWEPQHSIGRSTQLFRVFFQITDFENDDKTYYDVVKAICETWLTTLCYSWRYGVLYFGLFSEGDEADQSLNITGYKNDGQDSGSPATSISFSIPRYTNFSKNPLPTREKKFGFGLIEYKIQDDVPTKTEEITGDIGKALKEFKKSSPFDVRELYSDVTKTYGMSVDDNIDQASFSPTCEFIRRVGYKFYNVGNADAFDAAIVDHITEYFQDEYWYIRCTIPDILDPALPFEIKNGLLPGPGVNVDVFRAISGEIDLNRKETKIRAVHLNNYTDD